MKSDEDTEEFQNDMDRIRVVEFDPRLLRPEQMEIDSMNQLDVYRKRPRQWAMRVPVIPMRWVDE